MRNRITTAFLVVFFFVVSGVASADKIFLKSGKVIEGQIVNDSPVFVRIKTDEFYGEYLLPLIDHLEFDQPREIPEAQDVKESVSTDNPEDTLDTIILKTGRSITGTIIEQTPIFVRIETNEVVDAQNFLMENIERIDSRHIVLQDDFSQVVKSETKDDKAGDIIENDEKVLADAIQEKAVSDEKKIAPYQKILSSDSPQPSQPRTYRRIQPSSYPGVNENLQNAVPDMTDFSQTRKEIATLQNASLSNQLATEPQKNLPDIVTETPHIFNTKAYNDFLDQTVTTSNYKSEDVNLTEPDALLKQVMDARVKAASGGAEETHLEKMKEMIPKVFLAIIIGARVPVFIGIVLLVMNICGSTLDKGANTEVNKEEEDKISKEEYENLTNEEKNRLSESPVKLFLRSVPRIFIYPARGKVLLATMGASVMFYIFRVAMYAPFYGFFAMIFGFCYIVACIVKIIETAVTQEREDLFDWPSFTEMVDWFGKAFLFLVGWLICHGTAIVIFINLIRYEEIRFFVVALSVGLFVVGIFVYPMYILSMSLVGGAASLNIINIVKAINATFVSYALTFVILIFTQILSGLIRLIPILGIPFFGSILKWFIFVYFLLVNMRLLGIFYKTHRLKLRWFGENE